MFAGVQYDVNHKFELDMTNYIAGHSLLFPLIKLFSNRILSFFHPDVNEKYFEVEG